MSFREKLYASYTLHPSHATTADTSVYDRVYTRVMLARAERGGTLPPAARPIGPATHDAA